MPPTPITTLVTIWAPAPTATAAHEPTKIASNISTALTVYHQVAVMPCVSRRAPGRDSTAARGPFMRVRIGP